MLSLAPACNKPKGNVHSHCYHTWNPSPPWLRSGCSTGPAQPSSTPSRSKLFLSASQQHVSQASTPAGTGQAVISIYVGIRPRLWALLKGRDLSASPSSVWRTVALMVNSVVIRSERTVRRGRMSVEYQQWSELKLLLISLAGSSLLPGAPSRCLLRIAGDHLASSDCLPLGRGL